MPDWTYHPLRPLAVALFGARRSQRAALRTLAALVARPAGRATVARAFDHPAIPVDLAGRFGATVPVGVAADAVRALPVQCASTIEVGPVGPDDVDQVRRLAGAAAGGPKTRLVRLLIRTDHDDVAAALAPHVDGVNVDAVRIDDPDVAAAARALSDPATVLLATPALLVAAGPSWFHRVIEARTSTSAPPTLRDIGGNPLRWPGWFWGMMVGAGMIVAGLGAAAITLWPLLLWYDRDYLGTGPAGLRAVNHHLVPFLQHDRITMAATMAAIGALYVGLSWGGIRRGWPWARTALLLSGCIGFPTLFYFLVLGFVEPLHTAAAIVLFPMFLAATWRRPAVPRWTLAPDGPEPLRRRALTGQLLMIVTGVGLFVGGAVVSVVGLTDVFVGTDLGFLHTDAADLTAANPHLMPFIAHDRAGFGGALMSAAVAITLLTAWGWRRGEAWVWWSLASAAVFGFVPALVVHMAIGYTDFEHLAPVYFGATVSVVALALSAPFLLAGRRRWSLPDSERG